nr:ABC-ATPase domain-containing protein [bacterium]
MKTAEDLRRDLRRIDRKPYGFYKDLKGVYDFGSFRLTVDYVQPDPFAPPSQVAARLAAALLLAPVALAPMLATPAQAQWTVFDPTNYVQNVLTAARSLQQI